MAILMAFKLDFWFSPWDGIFKSNWNRGSPHPLSCFLSDVVQSYYWSLNLAHIGIVL